MNETKLITASMLENMSEGQLEKLYGKYREESKSEEVDRVLCLIWEEERRRAISRRF